VGELRKRVATLEARIRDLEAERDANPALLRLSKRCSAKRRRLKSGQAPAASTGTPARIARRMERLADGVLAYRQHQFTHPGKSACRVA